MSWFHEEIIEVVSFFIQESRRKKTGIGVKAVSPIAYKACACIELLMKGNQ